MNVYAIEPHGFCWGVKTAVDKANRALAELPTPVYCLHALVHNALVVSELEKKGMVFVDSLDDVPNGAPVLFSAHGVAPSVRNAAEAKSLRILDATCPFVARAHRRLRDFAERGVPAVVVGHSDHAEVLGLVGEMQGAECRVIRGAEDVEALPFDPSGPVGVVCQTTLSGEAVDSAIDALRRRFPLLETSAAADICTATRDRQAAVRTFVRNGGDGVLVLGAPTSSNTRGLAEIAESEGAHAWRAGTEEELASCSFYGVKRLGVTAGASTPEEFFAATIARLSLKD